MTIFDMLADEVQDMEVAMAAAFSDPDADRRASRTTRIQGGIDALKRLWGRLDDEDATKG